MLNKIVVFIQILLIIPIIIIFFKRILDKYKVFKIEQIYNFRNKILLYKKKKDLEFLRKIEYVSLSLTIIVTLVVLNMSLLCNRIVVIEKKFAEMENTIDSIENNLKYFNTKDAIQKYPKDGLKLKECNWKDLFEKENEKVVRDNIEKELANKLVNYIGNTQIFLSTDFPSKKIFLTINSDFNWEINIDEIKKNISKVISELQEVEYIKQVNYSVVMNKPKCSTELLRQTYIRKKDYLTLQIN